MWTPVKGGEVRDGFVAEPGVPGMPFGEGYAGKDGTTSSVTWPGVTKVT